MTRTETPLALIAASAQRRDAHPALIFMRSPADAGPIVIGYRTLLRQVERVAASLQELGVAPGDGVAILMPAMPETVVALFAASSVAVAVPLNPLQSPEAIAAQLAIARAKVVFVGTGGGFEGEHGRAVEAVNRIPGCRLVEVPLDAQANNEDPWRGLPTARDGDPVFTESPERTAALFHTGGTTGAPKFAELSGRNMAMAAIMLGEATQWTAADRLCCALPLFHVGGAISCLLTTLALGATYVLPGLRGARDPEILRGIWKLLETTRTSILAMVPTSLAAISDIEPGNADLRALRAIVTGAAPLPRALGERIEARTGRPVCQIYGMTEMSGCCSVQPCDGRFHGSAVGFAPAGVRLEIREPSSGGIGEVWMRGSTSFQGYRTVAGRAGVPLDGWIASGDLGRFLDDGQLQLMGRSKDVIIRGGHNIDPLMIEEVAQRHPAVRLCTAVGMPDEYAGEVPVLYIVLHAQTRTATEEIADFVAREIAEPPARPRRIFVVDDIPLTPAGKIARYRLRQAAAVHRLGEEIKHLPLQEVTCTDSLARAIQLKWRGTPSATDVATASDAANRLGLSVLALS